MTKRINFTIEEFLLEELDYMAKKRGMSRSQLIAYLVSDEWIKYLKSGNVDDDYYRKNALEAYETFPFI